MPSFGDALRRAALGAHRLHLLARRRRRARTTRRCSCAKHVDETIDLAKGAALFDRRRAARFPIVGQIMEPGRAVPPAGRRGRGARGLRRTDDRVPGPLARHARRHGRARTRPTIAVPREEDDGEAGGEAAAARRWRRLRGDAEAGGEARSGRRDPWGEDGGGARRRPAAVRVLGRRSASSFPVRSPTGIRKPYFIFGDRPTRCDLWFLDLAKQTPPRSSSATAATSSRPLDAARRHRRPPLREGRVVGRLQAPPALSAGVAFAEEPVRARSRSRSGTAPAASAATSAASPPGGRLRRAAEKPSRRRARWRRPALGVLVLELASSRGHAAARLERPREVSAVSSGGSDVQDDLRPRRQLRLLEPRDRRRASTWARPSSRRWSAATSTRPRCTTTASSRWSTRCPRSTSRRPSSSGSARSTTA